MTFILFVKFTSAVAACAVLAPDERRDALDVVEVEGVLAGHGAVQPRLQVRRPGIPAREREGDQPECMHYSSVDDFYLKDDYRVIHTVCYMGWVDLDL